MCREQRVDKNQSFLSFFLSFFENYFVPGTQKTRKRKEKKMLGEIFYIGATSQVTPEHGLIVSLLFLFSIGKKDGCPRMMVFV